MSHSEKPASRPLLIAELVVLFILLPLVIGLHPARYLVAPSLWAVAAYAAFILHRSPGFSWRAEWWGHALSRRDLVIIAARFVLSAAAVFALTWHTDPNLLFAFPLQRPKIWAMIMLLYPLLSALPQELVFRSFFFRRYGDLFPGNGMLAASACAFGFTHILFQNMISPLLSAICGFFLGWSYRRHASLGRVALEHALYGDMVFTIGLGIYFVLRH